MGQRVSGEQQVAHPADQYGGYPVAQRYQAKAFQGHEIRDGAAHPACQHGVVRPGVQGVEDYQDQDPVRAQSVPGQSVGHSGLEAHGQDRQNEEGQPTHRAPRQDDRLVM